MQQDKINAEAIAREAKEIEGEIIKNRRELHSNPELSYKEFQTSKFVAEKLKQLGIEVKTGVGGTGVVGILRGSRPGKVIGLRADMDALPVKEEVDLPFKSKNDGVMHACGHDTHVAMLLGTAKILARHKTDLCGVVKFLFQPAEEDGGRGGAMPMIEDGALENPKVDNVFGVHIGYPYLSGTVCDEVGRRDGCSGWLQDNNQGEGRPWIRAQRHHRSYLHLCSSHKRDPRNLKSHDKAD